MATKHKLADLLIAAANDKDLLFYCNEKLAAQGSLHDISYVVAYPMFDWRIYKEPNITKHNAILYQDLSTSFGSECWVFLLDPSLDEAYAHKNATSLVITKTDGQITNIELKEKAK